LSARGACWNARVFIRGACRLVACTAFLLAIAGPARGAIEPAWVDRWRQDLAFLETEMPKVHADLFHTLPRDSFEVRIARLRAAVPHMAQHEIVVAIASLVAAVGDGHTRLTLPVDPAAGFFRGHSTTPEPKLEALRFHHLPIRLHLYSDGLCVRRLGREHAGAVGARVLRIGNMPAEEAIRAVRPVVQRDNASQVAHLLPDFLVIPEVLAACGVTDDPTAARFEVETPRGERVRLDLRAVPRGGTENWVDAADEAGAPLPRYLRDPEKNYWFEYLADDGIAYVRYREVYDQGDELLEAFADRVFDFLDAHPVEALVVDLRGNPGGNNSRNRPLLMGLIRSAKLREPGRLFVLVDRGTFSAALMLAVDLEKFTPALFVGEPTGGRPNHYGDSRKVTLPNSGLTVRVATLQWQYSDPRDDRDAIAPDVPVPLSSGDYAAHRDPVLDTVRAMVAGPPRAPRLAGTFEGVIRAGPAAYPFALRMDEAGGTFASRDLGIEAAKIHQLEHDARRLSFDVPLGEQVLHVEGRWMAGRLIGTATLPASGTFRVVIPGN